MSRYYEWLVSAGGPARSADHTPVYRSKRLAPPDDAPECQPAAAGEAAAAAVPPLCASFRGSTTLAQVFRAAVQEHGDRPLLGKRAVGADGAACCSATAH